jgi:hypothetical protein
MIADSRLPVWNGWADEGQIGRGKEGDMVTKMKGTVMTKGKIRQKEK